MERIPYIGELRQLVDEDEGGAARDGGRDRFCKQKYHLGYIVPDICQFGCTPLTPVKREPKSVKFMTK